MPDAHDNANTQSEFDNHVNRHLHRNYFVLLLYSLFGTTGFRLLFVPTFIPKYVMTLSGSNFIVGLLQAVGSLTHIITLFFSVHVAETSRLKKRVVIAGMAMRLQILFMALAGFFLGARLNLIAFFICFALFNLAHGIQGVIISTYRSKVIPTRVRGTFVGISAFLGGVTAWFVVHQASILIADIPFPFSYSWTFLAAFLLTTIGLCFFALSKESPTPHEYAKTPHPLALVREMVEMVRRDPGFKFFIFVRALSSASMIGNPFIILYATNALDLRFGEIANITSYLFITETLFTLVWGRIADRFGFRAIYLSGIGLMATAILLLITVTPSLNLIRLVFSLIGAGMGGFMLGSENIILEFGSIEDRPRRIAVAAVAGDIARGVTPLLGGLLADLVGYKPVFCIGFALMTLSGLIMYKQVEEPRFANKKIT